MLQDVYILLSILTVIITTWFSFFVFEKNINSNRNYIFLFLMCTIIFFNLFDAKILMLNNFLKTNFYLNLKLCLIFLFPPFLFLYLNSYTNLLNIKSFEKNILIILPFIAVLTMFIMNFSKSIIAIESNDLINFMTIYFKNNFNINSWILIYFIMLIFSFLPCINIKKLKQSNFKEYLVFKITVISFLIFIILTFGLVSIYHIFLFKENNTFHYFNGIFQISTLIFVIFFFVFLLKYDNNLTSQTFLWNTATYTILSAIITGIYIITQVLMELIFQNIFVSNTLLANIVPALIVAMLFEPINTKVKTFIDEIFTFFQSISNITNDNEKNKILNDLYEIKNAYLIFIFVFIILLFSKYFTFLNLSNIIKYLISATLLSITALNIIFKIVKLPYNITSYLVIAYILFFLHFCLISISTLNLPYLFQVIIILFSLLFLISISGLTGRVIAHYITNVEYIVPLCIVAIFTDIWSSNFGVTHQLVSKKSEILNYLLLYYPEFLTSKFKQYIGISDFIFACSLICCAYQFNFNIKLNYIFLNLSFIITFFTVAITKSPIPVMPFICFSFILANFKKLKVKKEDIKDMFLVLIVFIIIIYLITFLQKVTH